MLLEPSVKQPIRSLYAEVAQLEPEISSFSCVTIASIASEKFVALLRRVAAYERDNKKEDDETIVRHIYDLHLIREYLADNTSIRKLIKEVIQTDVEQFGHQSQEFKDNPIEELRYGLKILNEMPIYKKRYEKFIGPLVYHRAPASWDDAINTITKLASECLGLKIEV